MSHGFALPDELLAYPGGINPDLVQYVYADSAGPLNLSKSVTFKRNKQLWILAGSLYRSSSSGLAGVVLNVDGTPIITSQVFINNTGMHMATVPSVYFTSFAPGAHTVLLSAAGAAGYNTDAGDRYNLTLIELEDPLQALALSMLRPQVVTSLPTNPDHGMEVYYRVDAERLWHFRYDSTRTSNKWVFLGGAAVTSVSDSTVRSTASTGYVTLTGTPAFTAPLAGNYEVSFGVVHWNSTTPNNIVMATIANLGVGAPDTWAVRNSPGSTGGSDSQQSSSRMVTVPLTLANPSIEIQYRATGGTGNWIDRWLRVLPVVVGG